MDRLGDLVGFVLYLRGLEGKDSFSSTGTYPAVCEPFRLATATPDTLRALADSYWSRQHGED